MPSSADTEQAAPAETLDAEAFALNRACLALPKILAGNANVRRKLAEHVRKYIELGKTDPLLIARLAVDDFLGVKPLAL